MAHQAVGARLGAQLLDVCSGNTALVQRGEARRGDGAGRRSRLRHQLVLPASKIAGTALGMKVAAHQAKIVAGAGAFGGRDQEIEILGFVGPVAQRVGQIDAREGALQADAPVRGASAIARFISSTPFTAPAGPC